MDSKCIEDEFENAFETRVRVNYAQAHRINAFDRFSLSTVQIMIWGIGLAWIILSDAYNVLYFIPLCV